MLLCRILLHVHFYCRLCILVCYVYCLLDPAHVVEITDGQEDSKQNIRVYTDGSKSERGVGSGIATFTDSKIIETKKYKLNGRCSNNQAEQLATLKALENYSWK